DVDDAGVHRRDEHPHDDHRQRHPPAARGRLLELRRLYGIGPDDARRPRRSEPATGRRRTGPATSTVLAGSVLEVSPGNTAVHGRADMPGRNHLTLVGADATRRAVVDTG